MMKLIDLLFLLLLNHAIYAKNTAFFKLEEATIDSVHAAIKTHQLTCVQLVSAYLDRIKKYNLSVDKAPPINAITEINASVLNDAQAVDDAYSKTKQLIGPLHCIPILLKDNIDSFDMTMTSGSLALLGNQPTKDAFLVSRLRKAGAIMLGKAGMDEFAWGMFGISSRSGRIGNAYDPTQNPGGSSGGSAAAVSANFAMIAIGSDNSGSVRIPAAFNGVFGLRPSTGLISQQGIFPMGALDGIAGPLTRTTKDLAIVLDVLAQPDARDNKTVNVPRVKTYTAFLNANGLKGKRIGVVHHVEKVDTFEKMPETVTRVLQASLQKMRELGATIVDVDLPQFDNNRENNQAGEIQDVNDYLASFPSVRKNFSDICESDRTRTFGQPKKCLQFITSTPKKNSQSYQRALIIFSKNKRYVEKMMDQYHLDVLFIPISTHGSATYDGLTVNTWRAPVSSNAGLPSLAMTIGYSPSDKMPIGIELVGKQFAEASLIEIAYAYEQHTAARKIPVLAGVNQSLSMLSIPELNNLFSVVGYQAYNKVLKNRQPDVGVADVPKIDLQADVFRQIVADTTTHWQAASH